MAAVLKPNALTSLANLKESAGITASTDDNLLIRLINAASARIERYCSRRFYFGGLTEGVAGFGATRLRLSLRPVLTTPSTVSIDAGATFLASSEFGLDDKEAGFVMRFAGTGYDGPINWPWTAKVRPDITQDIEPGTERDDLIQVTYVGGYLTQPQYDAVAAWPGAAQAVAVGALAKDAQTPYGVWTVITAGVTGGSQPSWPSTRTAGVTIVLDGTATWMFVDNKPTLPDDLELACTDLALAAYLRRGSDLDIVSESLGDASVSYGTGRGEMPEGVIETLDSYRLAI